MIRFEVHPKLQDPESDEHFWHCRSLNGRITCQAEDFTSHDDAVTGIRTHLVGVADLLGLTPDQWHVASRLLTYFDVTGHDQDALPIYQEKPLYPAYETSRPTTSTTAGSGADHA